MFTPEHETKKQRDMTPMTPASVVGKRPPALSISDIMVENLSTVLSEESNSILWQEIWIPNLDLALKQG